ncbi:cobalt-precorrin 5A hydrolase [Fusobacterium animalis]|uniref:cobalt-precorrin 5A hydrolase n=1 Tax=Fusobacterium animalis TaxID=76859 RepID=UPI0030D582EE
MKLAFWAVTKGAGNIAREYKEKLKEHLKDYEIDVFTLKKYDVENTIQIEDFTININEKFSQYDGHIFIMASGIVIRKIASLIVTKDKDPAVLLIDEGKHFVISLLSGHLGGANELTYSLANILKLVPVVTTSSDVTGKIAVDTISQKINAELEDLKSAKDVTSLIVNGQKVNILLPKNVKVSDKNSADGFILVSNKKNIEYTRIYPKNLILGIGCKKDTKAEDILSAIEDCLDKNNLDIKSVKKIATVDVKENEQGLIEAVKFLNLDLEIISREEIKKIQNQFKGSDFVEKNIGVRAVSEPVALLASSSKGHFIVMKAKYNGITISIYEEEMKIYE